MSCDSNFEFSWNRLLGRSAQFSLSPVHARSTCFSHLFSLLDVSKGKKFFELDFRVNYHRVRKYFVIEAPKATMEINLNTAFAAGDDEGLEALLCPITQEIMVDPVIAADGKAKKL